MEPYAIVIPSRARAQKAAHALSLIPTATIYVDERERDDYANIPPDKIRFHRPSKNGPDMRNMLARDFKQPVIIQVDDDLRGVRMASTNFRRLVTDPDVILQIIENGVMIAEDLEIGCFGWGRTGNVMFYKAMDPIAFVHPIFASFGIRGSARHRTFDTTIPGRADVDFTMQALLHDRVVCVDRRFYFDHGPIFTGRGGNVDLIDRNQFEKSTEVLVQRWRRYVKVTGRTGAALMSGGASGVQAPRINVRRRASGVTGSAGDE